MVLKAGKFKSITPVIAGLLLRGSAQLMVESGGETGVWLHKKALIILEGSFPVMFVSCYTLPPRTAIL